MFLYFIPELGVFLIPRRIRLKSIWNTVGEYGPFRFAAANPAGGCELLGVARAGPCLVAPGQLGSCRLGPAWLRPYRPGPVPALVWPGPDPDQAGRGRGEAEDGPSSWRDGS